MIERIKRKVQYLNAFYQRQKVASQFSEGHQVKLWNWSKPFDEDRWLIDFIEQRGLLKEKPKARIALYSVFGPSWCTRFDNADARIFVERENLHKTHFIGFLHRFLDDDRFQLSLGFDTLKHEQYLRFPFWLMWSIFPPGVNFGDVKSLVERCNHITPNPERTRFCAYVCGHEDLNRRKIYEQFDSVDKVSYPGRLFHNDDSLHSEFGNDKIKYLRTFKFNLTPENSDYKDYVTEKLFEAIAAETVPIYNGSENNPEPEILNQDAIIFVQLGHENPDAVKLVEVLHKNPKLYDEFSSQPRFLPGAEHVIWSYYLQLESKLREIIRNI